MWIFYIVSFLPSKKVKLMGHLRVSYKSSNYNFYSELFLSSISIKVLET